MSQVILRRTRTAQLSAAEAISLVTDGATRGRVLGQSGDNVLVEVGSQKIASLAHRLSGWIVSEQKAAIPLPSTRPTARKPK